MKRILIIIKSTQTYVWINYPSYMPTGDRDEAIDDLYGEGWTIITVKKSVTLQYDVQ